LKLARLGFPAGNGQHDTDNNLVLASFIAFAAARQHKSQDEKKERTGGKGVPFLQIRFRAVCHGSFPRDAIVPKHRRRPSGCSTVTGMLYQWPKSVNSD